MWQVGTGLIWATPGGQHGPCTPRHQTATPTGQPVEHHTVPAELDASGVHVPGLHVLPCLQVTTYTRVMDSVRVLLGALLVSPVLSDNPTTRWPLGGQVTAQDGGVWPLAQHHSNAAQAHSTTCRSIWPYRVGAEGNCRWHAACGAGAWHEAVPKVLTAHIILAYAAKSTVHVIPQSFVRFT